MSTDQYIWIAVSIIGIAGQLLWEHRIWPNALASATSWPAAEWTRSPPPSVVLEHPGTLEPKAMENLAKSWSRLCLPSWTSAVRAPEAKGTNR